jgi:hypothetical protein
LADDENYGNFTVQLGKMGLQLRDIPGDGWVDEFEWMMWMKTVFIKCPSKALFVSKSYLICGSLPGKGVF